MKLRIGSSFDDINLKEKINELKNILTNLKPDTETEYLLINNETKHFVSRLSTWWIDANIISNAYKYDKSICELDKYISKLGKYKTDDNFKKYILFE